jgi:nicotinate-nucleotide pyrophosphorylase
MNAVPARILKRLGGEVITWLPSGTNVIKRPELTIIAAGGITLNNIREYAGCGADVIATSSMYHGQPFDLGVVIQP